MWAINRLGGFGMACNAWNHAKNCGCDFRGGHDGARPARRSRAPGRHVSPKAYLRPSGGIPAALAGKRPGYGKSECPKCGKSVYFVRPYNGGAVWFEAMGKPWPKHPCRDNSTPSTSSVEAFVRLTRNFDPRDDWGIALSPVIEPGAEVFDLDLAGVDLANMNLQEIHFERVSLARTIFNGSDLEGAVFIDCDLSGARFKSANLRDARIQRGRLHGTRFDKAIVTGVTAEDVDVSGAYFPGIRQ